MYKFIWGQKPKLIEEIVPDIETTIFVYVD